MTYVPGGLNYPDAKNSPDVKLLNSLTVDTLKSSKFQLLALTVAHSIFMKLSIVLLTESYGNISQCYAGK